MNVRRGKVSKRAILNVIATLASFGLMLIPIFQASSLFPAEKWTPVFSLVIGILNLVLLQVSNGDVRLLPRSDKPKRKRESHEIVPDIESILPPAEVAKIHREIEQDDT
jgi:hypothetical protein